jgi:thioesterase domain-containing protein
MKEKPGFTSSDSMLAVTTICFDISVLELFLPITTGGRVDIVGENTKKDGFTLKAVLEKAQSTMLQATPATWRLLLEAGWKGDGKIKILCGGEPLPASLANKLTENVGELWNMYGPTEATVWCTIKLIGKNITGAPTIGKPIRNTTTYILDPETLKPCALGEKGELFVGGVQLARGYNNREDITKEKFLKDPFSKKENPYMYRTGDLACYLPDGEIKCLGRLDYQVKISGYRIELGEIEEVLDKHPQISSCAVNVTKVEPIFLVAYYVSKGGDSIPVEDLQDFVKISCPDYMIPALFIQLAKLPTLPNGKTDKNQLPSPTEAVVDISHKSVLPPTNDTEKQLISFCEELLDRKPIGVSTNLFTIGADSLFSMRLHNKILEKYQKDISITTILQSGTIKVISHMISPDSDSDSVLQPTSKIIVPLNSAGTRPPFYFLHPAGGFIFMYSNLSKHLGSDQPFYGIQDPYLSTTGENSPKDIRSLSKIYADELVQFQPEGPYYIGGWSMGGLIAYDMAVLLTKMGKKVALVIILDQKVKEKYSKMGIVDNIFRGGHMIKMNLHMRAKKYKEENRYISAGFYGLLDKIGGNSELKEEETEGVTSDQLTLDPNARQLIKELNRHMKACEFFKPEHFPGFVHVFKCKKQAKKKGAEFEEDYFIKWKEYAPQTTFSIIPGSHHTCMNEPLVEDVASEITKIMNVAIFKQTGIPRETIHQKERSICLVSLKGAESLIPSLYLTQPISLTSSTGCVPSSSLNSSTGASLNSSTGASLNSSPRASLNSSTGALNSSTGASLNSSTGAPDRKLRIASMTLSWGKYK